MDPGHPMIPSFHHSTTSPRQSEAAAGPSLHSWHRKLRPVTACYDLCYDLDLKNVQCSCGLLRRYDLYTR